MSIEKMNDHYSLTNPASQYDEESLTALELAGRTADLVNRSVEEYNKLEKNTLNRLNKAEDYMVNNIRKTTNDIMSDLYEAGALEGVLQSKYFATPQMYGAKADGVTDDTEAFNAAIAENKRVFIPAGDYAVSDLSVGFCQIIGSRGARLLVSGVVDITGVYYPSISNVTFEAVGENRDHLLKISESYYGIFEAVQISNRNGVVNTGALVTKGDGENANGCYYQSFRSCVFNNLPVGIKFYSTANAHSVDNTVFYQCDTCVYIDGAENIRLTENTFQSFNVCGVKFDNTCNGVPKKSLVMGNYFEANSLVVDTTYSGDLDFSNVESAVGNHIIANHYTWVKSNTHVVNMVGENMVVDYYADQEGSVPNTLMGITAFKVNKKEYVENLGGKRYHGSVMPVQTDDDNIELYLYGRRGGANAWRRILTTGNSESDTIVLPPINANKIAQFNNGYLQLGYNFDGTVDRAITFDTNHALLKMYEDGKWHFYQKIVSGTTEDRPTWKPRGYMYFDSTLGKPIFSTGSNTWVDATGTTV